MTPAGWMSDNLAGWGAAWMFGGALLSVVVGGLIGWRKGPVLGLGCGLAMWGLGNLAISLMTALFLHVDSSVLPLPVARCQADVDGRQRPQRTLVYTLQRKGEALREVHLPKETGACPNSDAGPYRVRVRSDALASNAARIAGEPADHDKPLVVMVLWAAFGGFALLAASLLLGSLRPRRAQPEVPSTVAAPVSAWRVGVATLLGQLGGLVFLAALVVPWFLDGSTERAVQFALRGVAAAQVTWVAAGLLARTMTLAPLLLLLVFAAAALGVAELVRHG